MPRRSLLSAAQLDSLLAVPTSEEEIRRHYTLDDRDLSHIRQRRGTHNRLGFAVQLCCLRYPGQPLAADTTPPDRLLAYIAEQLRVPATAWEVYARRDETRREHALELQALFGYQPFTLGQYRHCRKMLTELALQTNKAPALAEQLLELLRKERVLVPGARVLERLCTEAVARGTRLLYERLTSALSEDCRARLDRLLTPREESRTVVLTWLKQPPGEARARNILTHLDRLQVCREVGLPVGLEHMVHQGRLNQLAREGMQMSIQHLRDLEETRRRATLVAILLDTAATLTDQILEKNETLIGKLFSDAKRKHAEDFQGQGKAVNDKVRMYSRVGKALIAARQAGTDPFAAIEAVVDWESFTRSVTEAEKLAQPESFDPLPLIVEGYGAVRRYAPRFLAAFTFKAAPIAQKILDGIQTLQKMNLAQARVVPKDAPTEFVKPRWEPYVFTRDGKDGIDRRFYELCVLSELRNALRAGDIWVAGSRQFRDFEEYLLPQERFQVLQKAKELPVAIETDGESYLKGRLDLLREKLQEVERLASTGQLPDAQITEELLKIKPLAKSVPNEAEQLEEEIYGIMPHLKITALLMEVDQWTDFTRHFVHLREESPAKDRALLMTIILADAINLGLAKMAEACPGSTFAKLDTLRAWHVRDETYAQALAELVPRRWRNWSTPCTGRGSRPIGGRERPPRQTGSTTGSAVGVNTRVRSTCATALSQG